MCDLLKHNYNYLSEENVLLDINISTICVKVWCHSIDTWRFHKNSFLNGNTDITANIGGTII